MFVIRLLSKSLGDDPSGRLYNQSKLITINQN